MGYELGMVEQDLALYRLVDVVDWFGRRASVERFEMEAESHSGASAGVEHGVEPQDEESGA